MAMIVFRIESWTSLNPTKSACKVRVASLINIYSGHLPSPVTGPESLLFDLNDGGPYVSSSDGRIFKYVDPNEDFIEYASTSPNRLKTICDGIADFSAAQVSIDFSTTVLLRNLDKPFGVAVSRDGSFVLVSEYLANRIQRVWLKGPRANSSDLFMLLA